MDLVQLNVTPARASRALQLGQYGSPCITASPHRGHTLFFFILFLSDECNFWNASADSVGYLERAGLAGAWCNIDKIHILSQWIQRKKDNLVKKEIK